MSSLPPQQPEQPRPVYVVPKPDNNLVLAIFSTLCCCVPTGIAAIVYSARVDGKYASGDLKGAQEDADNAKLWSYISIGLGLVGTGLYVLAVAAGGIEPR